MDIKHFKQLQKIAFESGLTKINNKKAWLTFVTEVLFSLCLTYFLTLVKLWSIEFFILELIYGVILFRWFVILHECGHKTLFSSLSTNSFVGHIASIFCLIPYFSWRNVHLLHHRWVGIIDKDPTQKDLLKLQNSSHIQNFLFKIVWKLWIPIPFAQFLVKVFWGYAWQAYKNKEYKNFRLGLFSNLVCFLFHSILIFILSFSVWATYFLPMLVVFYFLIENMNLPQHSELFPYLSSQRDIPIPFAEQDTITRSTHLPDWLSSILALNFNRHTEHHLFPATPWYNLNKLRLILIKQGYKIPHEVEFLHFMYTFRTRDPLIIYRDSLPKQNISAITSLQD